MELGILFWNTQLILYQLKEKVRKQQLAGIRYSFPLLVGQKLAAACWIFVFRWIEHTRLMPNVQSSVCDTGTWTLDTDL